MLCTYLNMCIHIQICIHEILQTFKPFSAIELITRWTVKDTKAIESLWARWSILELYIYIHCCPDLLFRQWPGIHLSTFRTITSNQHCLDILLSIKTKPFGVDNISFLTFRSSGLVHYGERDTQLNNVLANGRQTLIYISGYSHVGYLCYIEFITSIPDTFNNFFVCVHMQSTSGEVTDIMTKIPINL